MTDKRAASLEAADGIEDTPSEAFEVLVKDGPCDDCRHAARCGTEQFACDAFAAYLHGRSAAHWKAAARQPTRERFAELLERR